VSVSDYGLGGDHGDQLIMDDLGPRAGDRFQNIHSGYFATITQVFESGRRVCVEYRHNDKLNSMPWDSFRGHWTPIADARDLR
jgi:hypothetical protein